MSFEYLRKLQNQLTRLDSIGLINDSNFRIGISKWKFRKIGLDSIVTKASSKQQSFERTPRRLRLYHTVTTDLNVSNSTKKKILLTTFAWTITTLKISVCLAMFKATRAKSSNRNVYFLNSLLSFKLNSVNGLNWNKKIVSNEQ